jgi:hypothetical protein
MKSRLTLLSLILITQICIGQITINHTDLPVIGDTLRYSATLLDSTSEETFNISGANATWDFSDIQPEVQGVYSYLPKNQTPYNSEFNDNTFFGRKATDTLNIQGNIVTNVYEFYQNTNQGFTRVGLAAKYRFLTIANTFSIPDKIYQFPLNYGEIDSSNFYFSRNISFVGSYVSKGYRKNTVDSYGSITTPFGTFNCIRVKSELYTKDSVRVNGQPSVIENFTIEYKWLAAGTKIPVMQINGSIINGDFVPTTMIYKDSYRPISKDLSPKAQFIASSIYPAIYKDTVQLTSQVIDLERTNYNYTITPTTFNFVNNSNRHSPRPEIVFNAVGYYTIEFSVSNGFGSANSTYVDHIYAALKSSVDENSLLSSNLRVFPNPIINNKVTLSFDLKSNGPVSIEILNVLGKRIYFENKGIYPKGKSTILQEVPSEITNGSIIIKVVSNDGVAVQKVIKK